MGSDQRELQDLLLRACHDLRAPLRVLRVNAELLLKSPEKRNGHEFEQILTFLVSGARDAGSLVDGLANYALALHTQPSPLPVSTGALLRNVLAKLAAEIRDAGGQVTYDELPQVTGDPDRLMQLLENLVRNAIQARGEAPPQVHISAKEENAEVLFAVRDNGRGIESEDLERIFRPFERLDHKREGAGLGLAISRAIVEGHGGRIWAESVEGAGSTFYFTLRF